VWPYRRAMGLYASVPEMDMAAWSVLTTMERHGDHWDLCLLPVGTTAATAIRPPWAVRWVVDTYYPEDEENSALRHVHRLVNALMGMTRGVLEVCEVKR